MPDVPIRISQGSAEIYDEREYFRLENSACCGSLVALEYSARAQPSGRSIKNGLQVEWNLLFFTLIQWPTWRLIQTNAAIFKDNKENAAFSKSDHKDEFRMNNKCLIEERSIIYR